ncbi:MoaD/ThiS family protein [Aeoliella sp.]|uniref:MoaD/ThiS family protein n=1 Tax=Aeoliella sp. TaxID=2795800 RepID=UPI003CCBD5D5
MTVQVLLFAAAREVASESTACVELPNGASYAELKAALAAQYPPLAPLVTVSRLAAGGEFVSDDAAVDTAAELALIPPVSGG